MPCFAPMQAWRTQSGGILLGKKQPQDTTSTALPLPCGKCTGCRLTKARGWTLRCHLEMQQHRTASFVTLTYADDKLPPTLNRRHLQLWLKKFRKQLTAKKEGETTRTIRFFACGEYGEKTQRPHYHAIIFGGRESDRHTVDKTWGLGRTQCDQATPATIAYVAGYVAKKYNALPFPKTERVDPTTGEVYIYQPPFLQMSQGIGGHARKHTESWRNVAVYNGQTMPVPRYLHDAWKKKATPEEIEQLTKEKEEYQKLTLRELIAAEQIAEAKIRLKNEKRNKI